MKDVESEFHTLGKLLMKMEFYRYEWATKNKEPIDEVMKGVIVSFDLIKDRIFSKSVVEISVGPVPF